MVLQIEEQRNLIEKYVRSNIKFQGNEDLFEDFCNEAYQKSYIIFNSAATIKKIESYVQKVVNTSIVGVLKDSGRLTRTSAGFIKTPEVSFDDAKLTTLETKTVQETEQKEKINYIIDIEDPKDGLEETVLKKDLLQRIADAVCVLHSEEPGKLYLQLYESRYIKGLKQKDISAILGISQAEVSKRLVELSELIKRKIVGT